MNFIEAIDAIMENKKVRATDWPPEQHWMYEGALLVSTEYGYRLEKFPFQYIHAEFEVYGGPLPKTKRVWQWMYQLKENKTWVIEGALLSEDEAKDQFKGKPYKKVREVFWEVEA